MNMLPEMNKDDVKKEALRICEEAGYTVKNGIIQNLGKFEREPIETVYFYDCMLNGDGAVMKISQAEKEAFELTISDNWVYVHEDSQGFVTLEYYVKQVDAEEAEYSDMGDEF